jgi:hypothetical protein
MKLSFFISAAVLVSNVTQGQVVDITKDTKLRTSLVEKDNKSFITSDAKDIDFVHGNDGDDGTQINLRGANKDDLGTACKEAGASCKAPFSSCCSNLDCYEKTCQSCFGNGRLW